MMSQKFYVFRHGLATYSRRGYGKSVLSAKVLPVGIPPIKRLGKFLKDIPSDFNVCSEYSRCRQTAAIVSKITGKQFVFDKRLDEYHRESFEDFKNRVNDFLGDVRKESFKTIIICTHGAVIAAIKNLVLKKNFVEENLLDYPQTGVLAIIKDEGSLEIDFNL